MTGWHAEQDGGRGAHRSSANRGSADRSRSRGGFPGVAGPGPADGERRGVGQRSEEHTSELQSRLHLACRLLLENKNPPPPRPPPHPNTPHHPTPRTLSPPRAPTSTAPTQTSPPPPRNAKQQPRQPTTASSVSPL